MSLSATQSATASAFGQLQRQNARRSVAQLEAKAATLEAAAAQARRDADAAERTAGVLQIDARGARTAANSASLAVSASEAALATGRQLGETAGRIQQNIRAADAKNLYGSNGRSSGSGYVAGSLVSETG